MFVLFLWCKEGWTNEKIAEYLQKNPKTVQTHFSNIYEVLEINTKDRTTDDIRFELGREICPIIRKKFNSVDEIKTWVPKPQKKVTSLRQEIEERKSEALKNELPQPSPAQPIIEKPPPKIQQTQPSKAEPVYEKPTDKTPPSLEPFIKEPTRSQEPEPIRPPPQPIPIRPRTTVPSRPIEEQIRERTRTPWAFILAIALIGIVIFIVWRLLVGSDILEPRTIPTETTSGWDIILNSYRTTSPSPKFTNTPRLTPTKYITPTPTLTPAPTITPTPIPLPFIDNFTDGIRPEWTILGDTPFIENGELRTGHWVDDSNYRGITGLYVGNQGWRNYRVEGGFTTDCVNAGRDIAIGVRVQSSTNSMIIAPFKLCEGNILTVTAVIYIDTDPTFPYTVMEGANPISDPYQMTSAAWIESQMKWEYYKASYFVFDVRDDHLSLNFDIGTGVSLDLTPDLSQQFYSGGVFILLDESVAYDYIKISPLP